MQGVKIVILMSWLNVFGCMTFCCNHSTTVSMVLQCRLVSGWGNGCHCYHVGLMAYDRNEALEVVPVSQDHDSSVRTAANQFLIT